MLTIRRANDRGHANHGWLDTHHSFSFANYYDPRHMGYRNLRVINEDRVVPGRGFGVHPHRDMEIISYVLDGALEHRDTLGTGSVLRPGEFQRMSAGTGVLHSEANASDKHPLHFLQIWLMPEQSGLEPSYEQRAFPLEDRSGTLRLVVDPEGRDGALRIHSDAQLYSAVLEAGQVVTHRFAPGRHGWLQVVRGAVELPQARLETSDGAAIADTQELSFRAVDAAELLLFDLG